MPCPTHSIDSGELELIVFFSKNTTKSSYMLQLMESNCRKYASV